MFSLTYISDKMVAQGVITSLVVPVCTYIVPGSNCNLKNAIKTIKRSKQKANLLVARIAESCFMD